MDWWVATPHGLLWPSSLGLFLLEERKLLIRRRSTCIYIYNTQKAWIE